MFDVRTRMLIKSLLAHPLQSMWNLAMAIDAAKDIDQERKDRLLNGVFCLPEAERVKYKDEIDWLLEIRNGNNNDFCIPYTRMGSLPSINPHICGVEKGLLFVEHEGRKLFFPSNSKKLFGMTTVELYLNYVYNEGLLGNGLRVKSPHSYQCENHKPDQDDILLDIGCAEALYAFHWVEHVKKVYLFESERFWRKPLLRSFVPYAEKTVLVGKYVGDGSGRSVRLTDVISNTKESKYFIKMDIEGAERFVVKASESFLKKNKVKMSVCCYHRQDDADVISTMLRIMGFKTRFSEGYMLPLINGIKYPFFRHGVIYARNY